MYTGAPRTPYGNQFHVDVAFDGARHARTFSDSKMYAMDGR